MKGVLCHFRTQCTAAKQVLFDRLGAHRWKCTMDGFGKLAGFLCDPPMRAAWIDPQ